MSDEKSRKISRYLFYFETPLYELIKIESFSENILEGDVNAYNSQSGYETTFTIKAERIGERWSDYYDFYRVTLTCKRNEKDKLRFFIYHDMEKVVKLGQYPSMADIQFTEIGKKYDKFLSREDLREFKKAIGLAANGVGIGSFVYLRRIFENLIWETFEKNKKDLGISKEVFQKKTMGEKVQMLQTKLPSQLVEMKSVYKILSKGVHELSEQECLAYFPALKLSIELILEQKIEMDTKRQRDEAVKKQIASIAKEISK